MILFLSVSACVVAGCAHEAGSRTAAVGLPSSPTAPGERRASAPGAVAVLPFDNETVSFRGPVLLRELVVGRLRQLGYDAMPLDEVDARLRELGVTDGGQLRSVSATRVGEALGTEGLFYGKVEEFVHQNVGFIRRRAVRLSLTLVNAPTGETLWEGAGRAVKSKVSLRRNRAAESFVEGIASDAAEAVLRAPLLPEAERAVERLFRNFGAAK